MKITKRQLKKLIREQVEPGTNEWEEMLGYDEGYEDGYVGLDQVGDNDAYIDGWEEGYRDSQQGSTKQNPPE